VSRTPDLIAYHLKNSIEPFFTATRKKMASLSPLFGQTSDGSHVTIARFRAELQTLEFNRRNPQPPPKDIEEKFAFYGFKSADSLPFDLTVSLKVDFNPRDYRVMCEGRMIKSFGYDHVLTGDEVEELSAQVLKETFQRIKRLSGVKE
jgi:hypothetical protein